ncbi:MAG: triphosphoribosyl-dephospho-CoA synthase [Rhodocyclaceae bacterium]
MSAQSGDMRGKGEGPDQAEAARILALEMGWGQGGAVRKPGHDRLASPGHGMQAQQFLDSARAAAACLFEPGRSVGARLEAAVAATQRVAGCNTNLGILLLCAPLGCALQLAATPQAAPHALPDAPGCAGAVAAWGGQARGTQANGTVGFSEAVLRPAVLQVLDTLDLDDAAAAYRAIALANPGGLGQADAEDVRRPPSIGLRAAMSLAAGRDLIAAQYANGFEQVFALGLSAARAPAATHAERVLRVYLTWLATYPDSHVVRKHGAAAAAQLRKEARHWWLRLDATGDTAAGEDGAGHTALAVHPDAKGSPASATHSRMADALAAWDEDLKARGLNPGTSADLTVCTLFLAAALAPGLMGET